VSSVSRGQVPAGGWQSVRPGIIDPARYLLEARSEFSRFIAQAREYDGSVTIDPRPSARELFTGPPEFRKKRVEQIEAAAGRYFHTRPLKLIIADFSVFTRQINVVIPARGEMDTFSVVQPSCGQEETVELGRELPLRSIDPALREKIRRNSIAVTMRE
jgi:hypothetical protein